MHYKIHSKIATHLLCLVLLVITQISYAGIHKSPNDNRDYLGFTLPNQMKVLVISDPDTDKAAASLDLNIGSNANPKGREGLAHFLEHMLFLGTEKYPEAGSYQAFIRAHGGSHNAYTAYENTNYFFDVQASQLEPALERFSQFFIAPLFSETYVDRERHAVHSEYQSKLRDDGRRGYAATKRVMNPAHSYTQFAVGNLDTLSNEDNQLRKDLLSFYQQYYSANLMTLVVLGKQTTTELKALVEEKFTAVKNSNASEFLSPQPLFKSLPVQLNIKTLKDLQQLTLTFPTFATRDLYRQKPSFYIGTMLGYEGKGSLFSQLKKRGWANSLGASRGLDLQDQSSFQISIALTDEGYASYNEVIRTVFSSIKLLREEGVTESLYQEEQQLNALRFRFAEKHQPIHYVGQLARNLQLYPSDDVIRAGYLLEEFNPELIQQYLSQLSPENVLIKLQSQSVATDQIDPWFQSEYSVQPLTEQQLEAWKAPLSIKGLATRKLNPFVAENLSINEAVSQTDKPKVIMQRNGQTLWYQQDATFMQPKADFFISIISDKANLTSKNAVMTNLYTELVKDQLNETLYDALLAGLNTKIYPHMRGLSIRISGYNDKQQQLLDRIAMVLKTPQISQASFDRIKERYTQQLENARKDKPYNQTIGEVYTLLMQNWSHEKKLAALKDINLAELKQFVPQLLNQPRINMLAHGNLTPGEATKLAQTVTANFNQQQMSANNLDVPVVLLDKNQQLTQTLPVKHNDSAISVYFQGNSSALKTRAEFALLSEIMASPFYSRLRTEQQLGYVVFETAMPLRTAPGLAFVIQSPNTDPIQLEQHIDQFLLGMKDTLSKMSDAQLTQYKRSILSRINRKETKLSERSNRYWQEIDREVEGFDSREQLSEAIAALSLSDLLKSYDELPERRLTVRSFGEKHQQQANQQELELVCETEITLLKNKGQFVPEV
ncbi:MAG: insulinase family protein [Amphritea sp.]